MGGLITCGLISAADPVASCSNGTLVPSLLIFFRKLRSGLKVLDCVVLAIYTKDSYGCTSVNNCAVA